MIFRSKTYILSFFASLLIVLGCKQNTVEEYIDKDGNKVIREWYNKSQMKSVTIYTNADQTNFYYMAFYRDGTLKDSATFVNEKIHGIRKFYEESTGLLHYENYDNGLLNGPQKAIYSSGISSFEGYRLNNHKVGEWKFFYSTGKLITYEFYDSTGRLKYIKKYDNDGSILKSDGNGIITVVTEKTSLSQQESATGYAIVAMPEGCTFRLTITDISSGQDSQPFFIEKPASTRAMWEKTFTSPGEKRLLFTYSITNKQSGEKEISNYEQVIIVK
jgi:hypothetical protein